MTIISAVLLLTASALPAMEWKTEAWHGRVKAAEVAFGQGRYAEYVAQIGPAYGWLDSFRTVGILCRLAYCHGLEEAQPAVEELAGLLTVHCPADAERLGQLRRNGSRETVPEKRFQESLFRSHCYEDNLLAGDILVRSGDHVVAVYTYNGDLHSDNNSIIEASAGGENTHITTNVNIYEKYLDLWYTARRLRVIQ